MKRRDLPLHALRAFEAAARVQSITRAANELGVTHAAVSHQIRILEELTGSTLFDRRYKPLRLTAQGVQLLAPVSNAFDRLSRSTRELQEGGLEGELTISCVPGLAANWLIPLLGDFLDKYAKLRVHVGTDFWGRPVKERDADLAIAYGSAERAGKRVVQLGQSEFFPVSSPRLCDKDAIASPGDLLQYTLLHEYNEHSWERWFVAAGLTEPKGTRAIVFDSAHLSLQAARAGYGIALGDVRTVRDDLEDRRLVRLFDLVIPAVHPYYIVTPPIDRMKPAAKALEEWLIDQFQDSGEG